ncbi:MAG: rhodanese-like domain-containing protein [Myxococcota bacterium]
MSFLERIRGQAPIAVGEPAPALSLTADEGTWVRLPDYRGQHHVVLAFYRSLNSDRIDAWLADLAHQLPAFHDLDARVFGITTYRADKLRAHRQRLRLPDDLLLLYDPLAMDARRFQSAGRVRPYCKNTLVIVDKNGQIGFSRRGMVASADALAALADIEGRPLADRSAGAEVRILPPDDVVSLIGADPGYKIVDVRTRSEFEADHVPGSQHIPVDELPARYAEIGQTDKLVFMCQAGQRAAAAAEFVSSIGGRELVVSEGGMTAWSGDRVTGGENQR